MVYKNYFELDNSKYHLFYYVFGIPQLHFQRIKIIE